jgi:hypothetical protein
MRTPFLWLFVAALSFPVLSRPLQAKTKHTLLVRFAVMGGCRLEQEDVVKQLKSNPSSANLAELQQTLADLNRLTSPPRFTFFTGDIVTNLITDRGQTLSFQLNAWIKIVDRAPIWKKTELACIPGNHEVLRYIGKSQEVPNPSTYPIWQGFVKNHQLARRGGNGPTQSSFPTDRLIGDQSYTTYSFTADHTHFVLVNTDSLSSVVNPKTKHLYASWVPLHWLQKDFQAAQADPDVKAIVMLGHKPLHQRALGAHHTPIVSGQKLAISKSLERLMVTTPKFRAYLTGHEHLWKAARISPRGPWQIIMGNGGTLPDKPFLTHGWFGFTLFNVYDDGDIGVVDCRRPIPKPYYGRARPAVRQAEWLMSAGPSN